MSDRLLVRMILNRVPEARELNIVRYRQFYQAEGRWLPTDAEVLRRRRRHARRRFHDS